jgi:hypothetical protein
MKKHYFIIGPALVILLLMATVQVNAQRYASDNPGPHFGIKGGVNFSQFYVDQPSVDDESMKTGYHFGVFAKIPITEIIAIQPEVLYTNVGSKISYGQTQFQNNLGLDRGEVRFNLNYIQVPLALAINVGPLNIHAGPYAAYLISANIKDLNLRDLTTNQLVNLNEDDFQRWDYGLVGGLSFDFQNFTIGARYNHGLREIGSSSVAGNLTNNSRNAVGQIFIGFGL